MWFADVICDLDWFIARDGNLGEPRLRQSMPSNDKAISVWMCVYGSDVVVHHMRMVMDIASKERASAFLMQNLAYWIRALEVSTALFAEVPTKAHILPGKRGFMVVIGEGDEHSPSIQIDRKSEGPIGLSYEVLGCCLSSWRPETVTHLFYLSRFFDKQLPWDTRWLNGYRFIEWHFGRFDGGISKNQNWRKLLSDFETDLKPQLRPGQSLHGFFEETRAMVAHALVDDREVEEWLRKSGDTVERSFPVLERIVIRICNDASIRMGDTPLTPPPARSTELVPNYGPDNIT
jgi:hypothetical protein